MMIITKVGDKWISFDRNKVEIDLYKLIKNIKKYKIVSAKYIGNDLEILVQDSTILNGIENKKSKMVLFKDYLNNKSYFDILDFNNDIEKAINSTNKQFKAKKLIVYPVALTIIASGFKVMAYNQLVNFVSDKSDKKDNIDYSIIVDTLIEEYHKDTIDFPYISTNDNVTEDIDVNQVYNMLKEYCDYYGFDEETISKIYSDNYVDILNSNNEEVLYAMLSIHELETGHGTSKLCLEKNNMGGITFVNPDTGEIEFQHYPNAIAGALGFVINFDRIYKATIPDEYQDYNFDWSTCNNTIEYYMKPMYCAEPMNNGDPEWDEVVCNMKNTLKQNDRLKDINKLLNDLNIKYK